MQAGDCSIHNGRVLHGSPANQSGFVRYAYILCFQAPPIPAAEPKTHPWLLEKQDTSKKRRDTWFRRGGFVLLAWQKLRIGDLWTVAGLKVAVQRFIKRWTARA
jgi:hypothetical protein